MLFFLVLFCYILGLFFLLPDGWLIVISLLRFDYIIRSPVAVSSVLVPDFFGVIVPCLKYSRS